MTDQTPRYDPACEPPTAADVHDSQAEVGRRLLATAAREAAQRAGRSLPADAWDDPPHPATLDSSSYLLEP